MTSDSLLSWLATGLPLIGALTSRICWNDVRQLRNFCVIWSLLSLPLILMVDWNMPEGPLLLSLLPIAAMISLLGQPVHAVHRLSWLITLVCLALGIGAMTLPPPLGHLFLSGLLVTVIGLLLRHHTMLWPISWWGIIMFGLAGLGAMMAARTSPPISSSAALVTSMVLVPLLPFHTGYLTTLTRLPGNLPSFLTFLLPAVGLHFMVSMLQTLPSVIAGLVSLFALVGAFYGTVKALGQTRIRLMLAYGSLSSFSMLWWFAANSHLVASRAVVLVASVGLATGGLLIAWQVIRTRYGDDVDPSSISGLASSMPSYAVLVSLLALAAMGLPPFGVFAGFMGLLLHSPIPSILGLLIMLSAWLAVSWYIMSAVQRLLFGTRRSDLRYHDIVQHERAALLITVLMLAGLGLAPNDWFMSTATSPIVESQSWSTLWQR